MKFLKTIRLDPSDQNVFAIAANPDEWAIPGGFCFSGFLEVELIGKQKQAFSNGFLSVESFGFSTFVSVAAINQAELDEIKERLAEYFMQYFGAPTLEEARKAASAEVQFVLQMCEGNGINTLFTVKRFFDAEGEIREEFRLVDPPGEKAHARIWEIVEE